MRIKVLLLSCGLVLMSSCSSSLKKPSEGIASQTAVPIKTEAPLKFEAPKNEMTCKRGEEKRILEIETQQPKGCKLWYSRYETKSTVATSVLGDAYCEKVRENIQTNLLAAGFECVTTHLKVPSPSATTSTLDAQKKLASPQK